MEPQSQYHRQRLTAKDIKRLYTAGERDFRGANLRGVNLRDTDLSDADLSGADIRGTNFVNAKLRGTRFAQAQAGLQRRWVKAQAGLQRRWVIGQWGLVVLIALLAGFLQGFAGAWIGFY